MMKTYKTPINKRGTYVYEYDEMTDSGVLVHKKEVLEPGKNGVTKEHIDRLNKMDDLEVHNNNKNRRSPMTDFCKDDIADWERAHPGTRYSGRHNYSLDYFADLEEKDNALDKGMAANISYSPENYEENNPAEIMAYWLDMLTPLQQIVFYAIAVEKKTQIEIADDLGTSAANICKIYKAASIKVHNYYKDKRYACK